MRGASAASSNTRTLTPKNFRYHFQISGTLGTPIPICCIPQMIFSIGIYLPQIYSSSTNRALIEQNVTDAKLKGNGFFLVGEIIHGQANRTNKTVVNDGG